MNRLLTAAILTAALAPAASAQPYSIPSFTIDGGGGELQGATYTLRGTIGQPDAGLLDGAAYTLHGGFWFGPADVCFVDCDGSGFLNVDDIDCFITAFLSGNVGSADCDGNGSLNVDDIDCYVTGFFAGCP